jgi:hypothetical protein
LAEVAAYFKCGNLPAQACLAIAPVMRVWFDAQKKPAQEFESFYERADRFPARLVEEMQ